MKKDGTNWNSSAWERWRTILYRLMTKSLEDVNKNWGNTECIYVSASRFESPRMDTSSHIQWNCETLQYRQTHMLQKGADIKMFSLHQKTTEIKIPAYFLEFKFFIKHLLLVIGKPLGLHYVRYTCLNLWCSSDLTLRLLITLNSAPNITWQEKLQ